MPTERSLSILLLASIWKLPPDLTNPIRPLERSCSWALGLASSYYFLVVVQSILDPEKVGLHGEDE